jgi:hypothetical protein
MSLYDGAFWKAFSQLCHVASNKQFDATRAKASSVQQTAELDHMAALEVVHMNQLAPSSHAHSIFFFFFALECSFIYL